MASLTTIVESALKLLAAYPHAKFCRAEGLPAGGMGSDADSVTRWTLYFYNDSNSHVTIVVDQGAFGQPQLHNEGLLGDRIMNVPFGMDLSDAIERKRNAGYVDPFNQVILRFPLTPDANEPLYIFIDSVHRRGVIVGAKTGQVSAQSN
jgi:hypothetical protein